MKKVFLSILMCCMASFIVVANAQIKRVAITEVVDSQGNVDPGLKLAVRSSITTGINLVENYEAYERINISAMFRELDFQRTGYIKDDQIHEIGKMTGAAYIVIPELARLFSDENYVLTARIIDIETGRVTESAEQFIEKNQESVQNGSRDLAMKLLGVSRGGSSSATGMAQGRTLSVDGGKYKGEIFDGKPNGKGIIYYPESDNRLSLEGTFVNGDIRQGIMIFRNGNTYEGEFANGKMTGYGVYKWSNGHRYEGYWKDGVKVGAGKFFWPDGDTYEGEYANDKRNGYGVYKWSNGRRYEGYWKDGLFSGTGKYFWPDGGTYEGEFANDKRNGYGVRKYSDGGRYEGYWKDGLFSGTGKYFWPNGDTYEGEFANDKMTGYGVYKWSNGDRYEGYWKDDSRHGEGVYIYSNGKKEKCHYRNGTLEK